MFLEAFCFTTAEIRVFHAKVHIQTQNPEGKRKNACTLTQKFRNLHLCTHADIQSYIEYWTFFRVGSWKRSRLCTCTHARKVEQPFHQAVTAQGICDTGSAYRFAVFSSKSVCWERVATGATMRICQQCRKCSHSQSRYSEVTHLQKEQVTQKEYPQSTLQQCKKYSSHSQRYCNAYAMGIMVGERTTHMQFPQWWISICSTKVCITRVIDLDRMFASQNDKICASDDSVWSHYLPGCLDTKSGCELVQTFVINFNNAKAVPSGQQ